MAAAVALSACASSQPPVRPTAAASIPRALLSEARPIGTGPRFVLPASGPVTGACQRSLGPRVGVHVEVFAANRVLLLPAGIGVRPPWTKLDGRIVSAPCYGALVTLDPTGLVLVRPGTARRPRSRSSGTPRSSSKSDRTSRRTPPTRSRPAPDPGPPRRLRRRTRRPPRRRRTPHPRRALHPRLPTVPNGSFTFLGRFSSCRTESRARRRQSRAAGCTWRYARRGRAHRT